MTSPPSQLPRSLTEVEEDDQTTMAITKSTNISPSNNHDQENHEKTNVPSQTTKKNYYNLLLILNSALLIIGSLSAALVSKYYFIHKGSSRWVSTWVQSAGFPLLLLPVYLPYYIFKCTQRKPFSRFNSTIFVLSVLVGFFLGVNNLLFSWGNSYLPVSTSSLLLSSQLAFNLIFSVLIVKQKVTFTNLNCVVLLTISSVLLALASSHDQPPGVSRANYLIGFFSTLGAGLLFAVYLPIMETIYKRVYCYAMVVEMQLVMEIAATVFASVGMAVDGGFRDLRDEGSKVFDKGEAVYWWTIVGTLIVWQFCFLGTAGMVFLTTSLNGGICMTALMAINVVGGVVVYGEAFGGIKVVSTVMCVWGFCSYLYGMYVKKKKEEKIARNGGLEMNEIVVTHIATS